VDGVLTLTGRGARPSHRTKRTITEARPRIDVAFDRLSFGAGVTVLVLLTLVGVFLLYQGWHTWAVLGTSFLSTEVWRSGGTHPDIGVLGLLFGAVVVGLIAEAVAVPFGFGVGLFIAEFASPGAKKVLQGLIDLLAAVPSIDQRPLSATEQLQIQQASTSDDGLYHKASPTLPPSPGAPVGKLVIPGLGLQQAVVEGVGASQTAQGPGHVPGTAGLGQPGNAAVVGRNAGDGAPFGDLVRLHPGDHVVTATTQGESLYVVTSVRTGAVVTHAPVTHVRSGPQSVHATSPHAASNPRRHSAVVDFNLRTLFGATSGSQLTLVTSGSGVPWNSNDAVVVVARLRGEPYAPTPQESRSPRQQGTTGDANALPWLLLTLLAMALVLAASASLYRRLAARSAYLLTTGPLLALTIVAALLASRLLPAWS
jgi:sortase A